MNGHIVVAEELILTGAHVDVPRTDGVMGLACAARHGDLEMLQLLLFNGADVHYEDERGLLPLHLACVGRHRRVVEFLVKAGSDVRHASKGGLTPIQLADQNEHDDVVEVLQRYGARLDDATADRGTDSAGGGGWGSFLKDMLTRMWTPSARSVDDRDGQMSARDSSLSSQRRRATIAETVVLAKEPVVAKGIHRL